MYPGAFVETQPDKPALIMGGSGFTQTFAELDAAANRLSHLLRSAGVQPGDHVAICMENHDRYLEVVWGCHYAGAVYTACSSRLTSGELEYILNDCEAKVFITSQYKADQAAEIVADTPGVELRLMLDGTIDGYESYEDAVAGQSAEPLDGDRIAGTDMLYSSGTTGRPKGVTRPFKADAAGDDAERRRGAAADAVRRRRHDSVYLSPAPFYHAAPLRFCIGDAGARRHGGGDGALRRRAVPRARSSATASRTARSCRRCSSACSSCPTRCAPSTTCRRCECVIHAAAPCPVPVKQQMIEWFGPVIHEYYAGTEGNGFVYCNSEMWLAHEGTVGTPIGCIVHIVGDDGEELPHGEAGTVYFEGGATFEYHNDAEKTTASRHPKGWSTLGDVGYLDDDNFLYLTDRKAYMIISGGVNIYPQEAENVLVTHPEGRRRRRVRRAQRRLRRGGQGGRAAGRRCRPTHDDAAGAVATELIAFCRSQLADVKCPRSIDFRDELPRHPTGKLYKRLLKDEYWKAAGRSI